MTRGAFEYRRARLGDGVGPRPQWTVEMFELSRRGDAFEAFADRREILRGETGDWIARERLEGDSFYEAHSALYPRSYLVREGQFLPIRFAGFGGVSSPVSATAAEDFVTAWEDSNELFSDLLGVAFAYSETRERFRATTALMIEEAEKLPVQFEPVRCATREFFELSLGEFRTVQVQAPAIELRKLITKFFEKTTGVFDPSSDRLGFLSQGAFSFLDVEQYAIRPAAEIVNRRYKSLARTAVDPGLLGRLDRAFGDRFYEALAAGPVRDGKRYLNEWVRY